MQSSALASPSAGATVAASPIDRRLLHEQAVDLLRDMIVRGDLAAGSRLNERLLCERLGISRTPLREAMKTLAAEGLVRLLRNRGAIVAAIDPDEIADLFAVIGALEALSGELACRHATEPDIAEIAALHYQMRLHYARRERSEYFRHNQAIHEKIVEATRNAVLLDVYRKLSGRVRRARFAANLSDERWSRAVREHDEILDALTRRDGPRLRTLLQQHLRNKLDVVRHALSTPTAVPAGTAPSPAVAAQP
jgi:DNA-binding GntR family transcriptional regulator